MIKIQRSAWCAMKWMECFAGGFPMFGLALLFCLRCGVCVNRDLLKSLVRYAKEGKEI